MIKSENPDLLVNIFTRKENVLMSINSMGWGYGWGYGWNPYLWEDVYVSTSVEGTLYIDLIDAKKRASLGRRRRWLPN
jgi:hypothetical protein